MSEKLAIVRRWVELYNERTDVTEFLSLLDPELELQGVATLFATHPPGAEAGCGRSTTIRPSASPHRVVT
jgi:hypothetical protein